MIAGGVNWRQEYVRCAARWRLAEQHAGVAPLLCAALDRGDTRLALGDHDAGVALWARREDAAWRALWRRSLHVLAWRAVAHVSWAERAPRLLAGGPLALADCWELLVLHVADDERCGVILSRVRCGAGASGCWVDVFGHAFLSLELRRLAPALYCTTVWLNAATQETQSEYVGVRTPLLTVYNEDRAHITHVLVAETEPALLLDEDVDLEEHEFEDPGSAYLRAIDPDEEGARAGGARVLLAAAGCRLSTWEVHAPRPPPLLACEAGGLAQRVREQRARAAQPAEEPREPDEAAVRGACTPPAASRRLPAPVRGLTLHPRGRCVWAALADGGAVCVSLSLRLLCHVRAPLHHAPLGDTHLVQLAVSDTLLAWPLGGYSSRVTVRGAVSCAGVRTLCHGGAALCCVLSRRTPHELLVVTTEHLYVWQSSVTTQRGPFDHSMQFVRQPSLTVGD